jgi:hypothetical protein
VTTATVRGLTNTLREHAGFARVAFPFGLSPHRKHTTRYLTNVAADKHFSDAASPQWL